MELQTGINLFKQGDYEGSLKSFLSLNEDSLGVESENFLNISYYLGINCAKLKYNDQAIEYLTKALGFISKDFKTNFQTRVVLSYILCLEKNYTKAKEVLKGIPIRLCDTEQKSMLGSIDGYIKWSEGNIEEAIKVLENALAEKPDSPSLSNSLGYILADNDMDLQRAFDLCNYAVEQKPNNSFYLDSLGWVYYKMKDFDNAFIYLSKALELDAKNSGIAFHMEQLKKEQEEQEKV